MTSFARAFYFWFSLIYLIIRTLAVSLYSAEINDESKRPVETLRAIPRESWCLEVTEYFKRLIISSDTLFYLKQIKRFTDEVNFDVVALSGKKFFFLTRHLVLSVCGTIITYGAKHNKMCFHAIYFNQTFCRTRADSIQN